MCIRLVFLYAASMSGLVGVNEVGESGMKFELFNE